MLTNVAAAPHIRKSRVLLAVLMAALAVHGLGPLALGAAAEEEIEIYRVDKKVSDFPAKDDFSSPEAAYATINRKFAAGTLDWRTASAVSTGTRNPNRWTRGQMTKAIAILSSVFSRQRRLCLALAVVPFCGAASGQDAAGTGKPERRLGEIDVTRIRELHHITDTFGDEIWPGFDTRKTAVAINNDDKEELLVGHPDPPKEFRPFKDFKLHGQPVMIRDGVTRYGPRGGGWAVKIGGRHAAYVSTLKEDGETERYLSLLLHECFHCFQKGYRQRAVGAYGEIPGDDPMYSAMIGLESRILKAALDEPCDTKAGELAKMFVAVRHDRRKDMPANLVILEGEQEYSEGTATYTQARMYQLLAKKGGIEPKNQGKDAQYQGLPNAKEECDRMISRVIPPEGQPITYFHSMYHLGMAQCLVLDRVRPGWKKELREKGMTQFGLLEKQFPLEEEAKRKFLAEAKNRFEYDDLQAEQKKLVDERLDLIRGYIDAPGRCYRIHHGKLGGFKWKPEGPVYHVPASLEEELAEKRGKAREEEGETLMGVLSQLVQARKGIPRRRTVWAGGIRRFEKEGLVLESGDTPVIFESSYLEWFDPDPAPDESDMKIESEKEEAGTHLGVKIETDGFTLEAEKARIDWSKDVVEIHLMPK